MKRNIDSTIHTGKASYVLSASDLRQLTEVEVNNNNSAMEAIWAIITNQKLSEKYSNSIVTKHRFLEVLFNSASDLVTITINVQDTNSSEQDVHSDALKCAEELKEAIGSGDVIDYEMNPLNPK